MVWHRLGSFVLLSVLVSLAYGQTAQNSSVAARLQQLQDELPPCALTCMVKEIPKSSCQSTDLACLCTNKDLNNAMLACLSKNCVVVDQLKTQKVLSTGCGVPVRNVSLRIILATWPLYAFAVIAVGMRLVGRLQSFGGQESWDDYVMLLCLLTLTALAAVVQVLANTGEGQDIWMLTPKEINDTLFYFWIGQFIYCFLIAITKISILLLYLRIFTSRAFKWQCWTLITITSLYGAAAIIATGLLCNPIDYVWKGWDGLQTAKCVNINALAFAVSGINMALDILIIVLPLYQVNRVMFKTQQAYADSLKLWNLQMHTKKKLAVCSMFLVGLFVTICSAIRVKTILTFHETTNPTFDYTQLTVWSVIECSTGVICACMPGIANAIRRFWPKFLTTYSATRSRQRYGTESGVGSEFGGSKRIRSKTVVSITYAEHPTIPDGNSTRSDELELTPPTPYKQHESHSRYSADSSGDDRKYGYQG